jgi:hypothetical protein
MPYPDFCPNPGFELGDEIGWHYSDVGDFRLANILNEPANARTGLYRLMIGAAKSAGGSSGGTYSSDAIPIPVGAKAIEWNFYWKSTGVVIGQNRRVTFLMSSQPSATSLGTFTVSTPKPTYGPAFVASAAIAAIPLGDDLIYAVFTTSNFGNLGGSIGRFYFDDFFLRPIYDGAFAEPKRLDPLAKGISGNLISANPRSLEPSADPGSLSPFSLPRAGLGGDRAKIKGGS